MNRFIYLEGFHLGQALPTLFVVEGQNLNHAKNRQNSRKKNGRQGQSNMTRLAFSTISRL